MPKKLPFRINRRFKAEVNEAYDSRVSAITYQRKKTVTDLCNSFSDINSEVLNRTGGALEAYESYTEKQSRLIELERKTAAVRLKEDNGIKLGFLERWRTDRTLRKQAALEAEVQEAYQFLHGKMQANLDYFGSESRVGQFYESMKAAVEQSRNTPEHDLAAIGWDPTEITLNRIGYRPVPTSQEREAMAAENRRSMAREAERDFATPENDASLTFDADSLSYDDDSLLVDETPRERTSDAERTPVDPARLNLGGNRSRAENRSEHSHSAPSRAFAEHSREQSTGEREQERE